MKPITLSPRHPAAYKSPAIETPPQAKPLAILGWRSAALLIAVAVGLATFPAPAAPPYMEVNGRVVVEAEHFATNTPAANGDHWHLTPDEDVFPTDYPIDIHPNAHGDKAMYMLPDNNNNGHTAATDWYAAPWLDYVVQISTPGTYRLWLRWRGRDGSADSLYAQILELKDGTGGTIPDWYNYFGNSGVGFNGQWRGSAVSEVLNAAGTAVNASWNIATPGNYTIRVTFREDGCAVDKLCLQLESVASPTDSGPPESPILQNGPFIWSQSPAPGAGNVSPFTAYQVQIRDGGLTALSATDPTFLLNGAPLTVTKTKVGLITTLDAPSAGTLVSGSTNVLTVVYQDTAAASYTNSWQFIASTPAIIPPAFKIAAGQVSTLPGFTVNMHQGLVYDTNGNVVYNVNFPSSSDRAEGQLRDYYLDPATGRPYTNNLTASTGMIWGDGTDDLALPETYLNWNIRPALGGGTDFGNFVYNATAPDGFGFPDAFPPQFSGRTDATITNNFAAELITYLDLPAGLTRLGVNSDDGFRVTCGLNPRERYDTNKVILLGQFEGGRGAADSLFDINVAEAGIYPIRVLWYQGGGDANIELFHIKPNGTRILVNDIASGWKTGNAESIKAFRSATVPRSAVVDWLQPAPNAVNVPTNAVIQVQLGDSPDATVNQPSIRLYLNDLQVSPITTNAPPRTTLYYVPAPALTEGSTNTARVEFTDSLGTSITQAWTFVTVAAPVTTSQGEVTRKLWGDITTGATVANLTSAPVFIANVSYNTNGEPAIINTFEQAQFANPTKDNYGQQFLCYIKPEFTDWYTFYLSSDDASELRLSTNDSPANLRAIAAQASYNGNREYLTGRRVYERRSAPIYLEAGKRYFCEALHKEGTGGDNFAVAWWRTNDPPIVNGSAPISGAVLEKFVGVAFSQHPASVTTSKGKTVTLAAAAYIGVGTVSYQWLKDGGAVGGANALTYVISPAQPSHSGVYKLRITVDGIPYDSNEATVIVVDDTTVPAVVGNGVGMNDTVLATAGGPGYTVAIQCSEELDPNSIQTATITLSDPLNYPIERLLGGTGNSALLLKVAAALQPTFTVTLSGITDVAGNALAPGTVVNCGLSTFTPMVLGTAGTDPIDVAGTAAFGLGANAFQVTANGSDIWNNADAGHFIYAPYTGNFDAQVRVESLTRANDWSKAMLVARETLGAGSRYAGVLTTPLPLNNLYNTQWRDTADGGSGSTADTGLNRPRGVTYPNAWIRLIRQGDTFITLINTNNADWYYLNQHTIPAAMPSQLYVGLATTSHDNVLGDLTTAIYRDFQIAPYTVQTPNITGGVSLLADGNISLSFTAALWQSYRVLASTNVALPLAQWTVINQGAVTTAQPVVVMDLNATNYPARFYSIVSP